MPSDPSSTTMRTCPSSYRLNDCIYIVRRCRRTGYPAAFHTAARSPPSRRRIKRLAASCSTSGSALSAGSVTTSSVERSYSRWSTPIISPTSSVMRTVRRSTSAAPVSALAGDCVPPSACVGSAAGPEVDSHSVQLAGQERRRRPARPPGQSAVSRGVAARVQLGRRRWCVGIRCWRGLVPTAAHHVSRVNAGVRRRLLGLTGCRLVCRLLWVRVRGLSLARVRLVADRAGRSLARVTLRTWPGWIRGRRPSSRTGRVPRVRPSSSVGMSDAERPVLTI